MGIGTYVIFVLKSFSPKCSLKTESHLPSLIASFVFHQVRYTNFRFS